MNSAGGKNNIKGYDENHITLVLRDSYSFKGGKKNEYSCFLDGNEIGGIDEGRNYGSSEKYRAYVFTGEESGSRRDTKDIGYFSTLFAAKASLLKPAREYLAFQKNEQSGIPVAFLPEFDTQFYPTPPDVAGKLISGIDWMRVNSVLEPSAGRGDLLDCAKRRSNAPYRAAGRRMFFENNLKDVDCIEIDPNLRAMLTGKGYRVVHDDFLDFYTKKRYSLILMNPPFSNGDAHLLHALELMEHGGQIACILNAETLKNPFTNRRKALVKELRRYGASVRYVSGGFKKSARRSDVEIALINVSIPIGETDTSILDELEKAREADIEEGETNELAPSNHIDRLILEYNLLCEAGIAVMQKYNGVVPILRKSSSSPYGSPIISMKIGDTTCNGKCGAKEINRFLRFARSRYWNELFDLPELRGKMTSDMRYRYSQTVSDMAEYEFSEFNIRTVVQHIMGQLNSGVEEAIVKCFDKLSSQHSYHRDVQNDNIHYYNGWKTNKAHYVNSRVVIPTYGCFAREYKPDKYGRYKETLDGISVHGCFQTLSDLELALDYLDKGETEPVNLEQTLEIAAAAGRTTVSCKYFEVRFYKKGTCHIKFHDQKIVDRLNIYVGRNRSWLPPVYGKVQYSDMDAESKRVVDEFQGREKYEDIFKRPNDYIIETKDTQMLLA